VSIGGRNQSGSSNSILLALNRFDEVWLQLMQGRLTESKDRSRTGMTSFSGYRIGGISIGDIGAAAAAAAPPNTHAPHTTAERSEKPKITLYEQSWSSDSSGRRREPHDKVFSSGFGIGDQASNSFSSLRGWQNDDDLRKKAAAGGAASYADRRHFERPDDDQQQTRRQRQPDNRPFSAAATPMHSNYPPDIIYVERPIETAKNRYSYNSYNRHHIGGQAGKHVKVTKATII
jgi:hypothetical protein